MNLWRTYFHVGKCESSVAGLRHTDRRFQLSIQTDGVGVKILMVTPKESMAEDRVKNSEPKSLLDPVAGPNAKTMRMLAQHRISDHYDKVVVSGDPGHKPLLATTYNILKPPLSDGELYHLEPFVFNAQQRRRIGHPRKRRQRKGGQRKGCQPEVSPSKSIVPKHDTCNRRQRKKRKGRQLEAIPTQPVASIVAAKDSKYNTRNRRQFSRAHWDDVTGQGRRNAKLMRWMSLDQGMSQIQRAREEVRKQSGSHSALWSDFNTEITSFLKNLTVTLGFFGRKRWRRLRFDAHIGRKRAQGEVIRRFYPCGTDPAKLVFLYGDGDFQHNMAGNSTAPKNILQTVLRRGYRGGYEFRQEKWHARGANSDAFSKPSLFLPGNEFKSSQLCPVAKCGMEVKRLRVSAYMYQCTRCKKTRTLHRCVGAHRLSKWVLIIMLYSQNLATSVQICARKWKTGGKCAAEMILRQEKRKELYKVLFCDNASVHQTKYFER